MNSLKRTCSIMTVAALLAAPSFIAASPTALIAQADSPAAKYDDCMDGAEESFLNCLEAATEKDILCWSRFGWAKIACSISYGIREILR